MKRQSTLTRTALIAAACAGLTACADGIAGPETGDDARFEPAFLIGSSPLLLSDPSPSPLGEGMGLSIGIDVSKSVFDGDVDRYAFRTTVTLTLGDGSVLAIDPKVDPAATVDPKGDPVTLTVPFEEDVSDALARERGPVRTDVTVELLDMRAGSILDARGATKSIRY